MLVSVREVTEMATSGNSVKGYSDNAFTYMQHWLRATYSEIRF